MKTSPALRFGIIVTLVLFGAIALRTFAANKKTDSALFTLKVNPLYLKCTDKCEDHHVTDFVSKYLKSSSDVCFRKVKNGRSKHWIDGKPADPTTCADNYRPGSPHVQQTAAFNTAAELKAAADALASSAASTQPPPTSSPAPQVQQHVELTTPQAAKAITVALSR